MLAAIETTGETCGVALFDDDRLVAELHAEIPRAHDRLLAKLFREALEVADARASDVSVVAVSTGPGSYTGIRIGLSFALGLALATGAGMIPVPTLDAVAYGVRDLGKVGHRSRVISLIPAGRRGVYAGLFQVQPEFRRLTELKTVAVDQIPPLLDENVFAAGPGAVLLEKSCLDCIAIDSEVITAKGVGEHAIYLRRLGLVVPPEGVEPLYISDPYLTGALSPGGGANAGDPYISAATSVPSGQAR